MSNSEAAAVSMSQKQGNIHIYIDNSNLWIQGQKTYAEVHNQRVSWNPKWRFDVGKVQAILTTHADLTEEQANYNVNVKLYGSTPPPVDTVWKAIESHNVKVSTFAKSSFTNREKEVDGEIIADSVDEAGNAWHLGNPCVFMIVSGDRDISRSVIKIAAKGFPVHVWSWKNSLSKVYLEPPLGVNVYYLDEYLEEIGFEENTFRVDRSAIGPESFVILDPLRTDESDLGDEIDNFVCSLRIPVYRYEMSRPGMTRPDLVVIPTENSVKDFEISVKATVYETAQKALKKHGLEVLTYLEYFQRFLKDNQNAHLLKVSNRFKEFEVDMAEEDNEYNGGDDSIEEASCHSEEFTVVKKHSQQYNDRMKRDEHLGRRRCNWGKYCRREKDCKAAHSKEDETYFQVYGHKQARKVNRCPKEFCNLKACNFAHSDAELFCPTCEKHGHQMKECSKRSSK